MTSVIDMVAGIKKTHIEYVKDVKRVHGNTITVIGRYVNDGVKIKHRCSARHTYVVRPNHVLRGVGCEYCARVQRGRKRRKSHSTYVAQVQSIHRGAIIVIGTYVGAGRKIEHQCSACDHVWMVTPDNVVNSSKTGCPKCQPGTKYSNKAIRWLRREAQLRKIRIRHAGNWGEYTLPGTRITVDGYHKPTNTVFEFHGDCFHGNPKVFTPRQKCHPFSNKTAGRLYKETKARERKIRALGYTLITVWESDYDRTLR